MQHSIYSPVLRNDDYDIIRSLLRNTYQKHSVDRKNMEELQHDLKRAKLVTPENFPPDVVRLNSRVKIKEESNDKILEFIVVTPEKANVRERRISVMAPIGAALIGFREGQKVKWQVPSGKKTFTIMEVHNYHD